MTFEDTVREYLVAVHQYVQTTAATGETTAELSYRPVLDAFIRKLSKLYCPDVDVIFEPKAQRHAGRPDWRLYNKSDLGLYGFVEAKGLDPINPINIRPHREQIERYLTTGHRVILTDGLEFIFFTPGAIDTPHRHCLVNKPIGGNVCRQTPIDYLLDNRLREFFRESGSRQCSEEQLIHEMAVRASALSDCVLVLSQAPVGSGVSQDENRTIEILHELQLALRLQHDPVLQHSKVFADFVAQVLCFGLLYAHRVVAQGVVDPQQRYDCIRRFWSDAVFASYADRLVPFKALVAALESELSPDEESASQLRCWYDDSRRLLAHIQLRDSQHNRPDYHTLYERFLADFDPTTRFDFGAFYTPRELASFTIGTAKAVIESTFQGRTLFEKGNKIIDPCCGTGTFLEQLVRHSTAGDAAHLVGFEILPAPYALAHYRMVMLKVDDVPNHAVDVFLTNTLSDELVNGGADFHDSVLREELNRARDCARPPIVLVIGNPPSSDSFGPHSTGDGFSTIDTLLDVFRPPKSERRARQNIQKQIGNDFVKFLRWASDKALGSKMGVIALILPSTFAAHPTYRPAREWLVKTFGHFWAMDIDRDLRTGVRSSSLFNTQQGRMLLIAAHSGTVPNALDGRFHYATITDKTRAQKKQFLELSRSAMDYLSAFRPYELDAQTSAFRPGGSAYDRDLYSRFWAIHPVDPKGPGPNERCVFARHCSGTKLAPTALFVHASKPVLQRRSREIGCAQTSVVELKERWFSGQRKPPSESKLTTDVRMRILNAAANEESYRRYAFRPFVSMHLLLDDELLRVLSRLGGGGTRLRPEVASAFSTEGAIGIAIAPSPIDIGEDLHRFATFCWHMPDNDLCARGNAHIFCDRFPDNKPAGRGKWNPTPKDNISALLLSAVRSLRPDTSPRDLVFYSYAVLCSGTLLEAFADAYFTASAKENIPRIPIVKDLETMERLIEKGRKLAELESPDVDVEVPDWVADFEGQYRGQFNLRRSVIDSEYLEIRLYSERKSPEIRLEGVPEGLLKLTISGYEVIACWLKFHSFAYTRTAFSETEFKSLLRLLACLHMQTVLTEEVDALLEPVISGEVGLI